nr:MAG TPA: minor capsid protein [Caudoviricetes sp.]
MAKTKATPTEKYWKKRQEELEKKWDKKSREEIERELRAYYEQSLTHIEKDISALYQRFATDNGMDMAAAQQLLTGKEYRVWRMDIAEYVKEINATGNQELLRELNTLAMRSRITRLDALRAGTLKEMALLSKKTEKAMKEFLKSGYEDFYYHGLYEIGKKRGLEGAVSLVDGEKLERVLRVPWSGKNYSKRIWTNGTKLAKTIQQNIIAAAHRGVSVQEMTRVIRQKMGVGTKEAVRLVRTELNYVQNQAALHSIKDAGMKYYRFIATLDKRTSTVCQSHDGDVFPVEEAMPGKNMPPLHPHCRSVISGCLTGEYRPQSGTRIARDENGKNVLVPANMKYDDWRAVYLDKKLTLEEWEAGNVALQATNAAGALNAGVQSGTIKSNLWSTPSGWQMSSGYKYIMGAARASGVEYRSVSTFAKLPTDAEIISRLAGGDKTKGSCASLALAYAGNKAGLDVIDFRGGQSQGFFSRYYNLKNIAHFSGVVSREITLKRCATDLAKYLKGNEIVDGKEYCLIAGAHASVIRRLNGVLEYLELQSPETTGHVKNGWNRFDRYGNAATCLYRRFGCKKTVASRAILIEIDSFLNNPEIRSMLGYINTDVNVQMKGVTGNVK